jgi:hypothetical protein
MFNGGSRQRASVIWLETGNNASSLMFAREPIHHSAALGDLDQDGWLDVVACGCVSAV